MRLVRDSLYTFFSFIFSRLISILKEFVLPLVLTPYELGIRNTYVFFHNLSSYLLGGVPSHVFRSESRGETAFDIAWSYSWVLGVLVLLFLSIIGYFTNNFLTILLGLIIIPRLHAPLIDAYLQSKELYSLRAKIEFAVSLFGSFLVVLLSYFYNYWGALVGLLISLMIRSVWFISKFDIPIRLYSLTEYGRVLKSSLGLYMTYVSGFLYSQIDKFVIVLYLSPEFMAFYGMANVVFLAIVSSIDSIVKPYYPKLMRRDSKWVDLISKILVPFSLVVGIVSILLLNFVVDNYYPLYAQSVNLLIIFLPAIVSSPIYLLGQFSAVGLDREHLVSKIYLMSGGLNLLFSSLSIFLGYGIEGVALSTVISYFVFNILLQLFHRPFNNFTFFVYLIFFVVSIFFAVLNLPLELLLVMSIAYLAYCAWVELLPLFLKP